MVLYSVYICANNCYFLSELLERPKSKTSGNENCDKVEIHTVNYSNVVSFPFHSFGTFPYRNYNIMWESVLYSQHCTVPTKPDEDKIDSKTQQFCDKKVSALCPTLNSANGYALRTNPSRYIDMSTGFVFGWMDLPW